MGLPARSQRIHVAAFSPNIDGRGPVRAYHARKSGNACGDGRKKERTEHREDPHAEIVEHAKLLHVALLELLLGEREKLDLAWHFGGIHDGDT